MHQIYGLQVVVNFEDETTTKKIAGLVAPLAEPITAITVPAPSNVAISPIGNEPSDSIERVVRKNAKQRSPDIGFSDFVNLTRAKAAALEWAERKALLVDDRKTNAARRLKSLNNFWWSSSLVRNSDSGRLAAPSAPHAPAYDPVMVDAVRWLNPTESDESKRFVSTIVHARASRRARARSSFGGKHEEELTSHD